MCIPCECSYVFCESLRPDSECELPSDEFHKERDNSRVELLAIDAVIDIFELSRCDRHQAAFTQTRIRLRVGSEIEGEWHTILNRNDVLHEYLLEVIGFLLYKPIRDHFVKWFLLKFRFVFTASLGRSCRALHDNGVIRNRCDVDDSRGFDDRVHVDVYTALPVPRAERRSEHVLGVVRLDSIVQFILIHRHASLR